MLALAKPPPNKAIFLLNVKSALRNCGYTNKTLNPVGWVEEQNPTFMELCWLWQSATQQTNFSQSQAYVL
jgi:hypothetical protein